MQPWSATFTAVATNPCKACPCPLLSVFPNANQKSLSHMKFLFLKFSNKYRPLESGKKVAIKISCHICGNELFSPDKWLFVFLQLGTRSPSFLPSLPFHCMMWKTELGGEIEAHYSVTFWQPPRLVLVLKTAARLHLPSPSHV